MNVRHLVTIILLATIGIPVTPAAETSRPAAPNGFAWRELEQVNGAVLVPDGWHFSELSSHGTLVYRVTREKLDKDSKTFRTGLTINVVKSVKSKSKAPPAIYAVKHVLDYIKAAESATEPKVDKAGKFQRITCYVVKKMPDVDPDIEFRIRLTTLANDETDTLYVLTFGTPKTEWDVNYEIGKTLFNPIMLDQGE